MKSDRQLSALRRESSLLRRALEEILATALKAELGEVSHLRAAAEALDVAAAALKRYRPWHSRSNGDEG